VSQPETPKTFCQQVATTSHGVGGNNHHVYLLDKYEDRGTESFVKRQGIANGKGRLRSHLQEQLNEQIDVSAISRLDWSVSEILSHSFNHKRMVNKDNIPVISGHIPS